MDRGPPAGTREGGLRYEGSGSSGVRGVGPRLISGAVRSDLLSMPILTRYLLRLHLGPFLFALSGLTLLLLLDQVSKRFGRLVGKGLHWTVIGEVFLYSVPFIIAQTFPMAVLIAVLYVYNRMAIDHELTAIRANGIPIARTLVPLLLAAAVMAAGMTYFNDTVLPESNHRLQVLLGSIAQKKPTFELREQSINEVLPSRLYVQVARIDRADNRMEDVVIYDRRAAPRTRTIYADSAEMAYDSTRTDLYLTVHDGIMHDRASDEPEAFQRIHFGRMNMRIPDISNQLERDTLGSFRSDREMRIGQMREFVAQGDEMIAEARRESRDFALAVTELLSEGAVRPIEPTENAVSVAMETGADSAATEAPQSNAGLAASRVFQSLDAVNQFVSLEDRQNAGIGTRNKYGVEIQKKFTIPAACIVFVLIGAPIAMRYPQAGVALVVGVSLGFFAAYYVALVGGEELSDNRILSPFWAMWAPNILFGGVGLLAVWRMRRATR